MLEIRRTKYRGWDPLIQPDRASGVRGWLHSRLPCMIVPRTAAASHFALQLYNPTCRSTSATLAYARDLGGTRSSATYYPIRALVLVTVEPAQRPNDRLLM